jgi:hypothetical protein
MSLPIAVDGSAWVDGTQFGLFGRRTSIAQAGLILVFVDRWLRQPNGREI